MKRKNEEMQGELSNLRQLYDYLRLRPEQEALEILRRIRSNASPTTPTQRIQELADFVRHGDLLIQPSFRIPGQHRSNSGNSVTLPPLRMALDSSSSDPNAYSHCLPFPSILSMGSEGPTPQRRRHISDADVSARLVVICQPPRTFLTNLSSDSSKSHSRPSSIEAILHEPRSPNGHLFADPRLESVRNWTTITYDNNLLTVLMNAWHLWEYKYHHFLDWDIFLDDLASENTNFCSKLLVNAMLASGSVSTRSQCFIKLREGVYFDSLATH
jgi:hypothetical protein